MDELWTPWRMSYIVSPKHEADCIFCDLPSRDDHHHYILERDEFTFTILNLYPYAVGHVMIIPFGHCDRMDALDTATQTALVRQLDRIEGVLQRTYRPERVQVGINLDRSAGAGVVGHLHVHLVPRTDGATPATVTMDQTYERLHTTLRETPS